MVPLPLPYTLPLDLSDQVSGICCSRHWDVFLCKGSWSRMAHRPDRVASQVGLPNLLSVCEAIKLG